jgi:hypothetical protein
MARPFFSTTTGSVTCPRCGNFIASDTETCMHCGADLGHARADEGSAGPSLASSLRLSFTARRHGVLSAPYPSLAEASELGHRRHRKDVSKAVVIGGIALVLVAGGVIYYAQRGDSDTEAATGQSVFGPIDAKLARDSAPPKPVAGTAAVLPAPTPMPTPTQPPRTAFQPAPQPTAAPRTIAPAPAAPSSRDAAQASTIDNLQAARDAIDRGDLTTARRRFSKIPASQLEPGNVQRTQAELVRLEHARDDSLQFARACAATESWACARQNARDVLAIDASNTEAQALVESSIERSGWLNPPRPAPTHSGAARAAVTSAAPSQASNRTAAPPRARSVAVQPPPITRQPPLTNSAAGTRGTQGMRAAAPSLAPPDVAQGVQRQPAPVVAQQIAPAPVVQATPVQAVKATQTSQTSQTSQAPQATQPAQAVTQQALTAPAPSVANPAALAPATAAVPPVAPPASIQPAPSSLPATVAGNPPASVPKHSSFDAANPDDRERAILENGWTKNRPPAQQQPPSQ